MVFVHHDPVVVLATSVTAASGMLTVLAHAAITHSAVTALLAVLAEVGRLRVASRAGQGGDGARGVGRVNTRVA